MKTALPYVHRNPAGGEEVELAIVEPHGDRVTVHLEDGQELNLDRAELLAAIRETAGAMRAA